MKRNILVLIITSLYVVDADAQSLEAMPGTERIFIDMQWLKTFEENGKWSLFGRSRATVDYEDNTNLFTGAYLNYTTQSGVGLTVLGRISTSGGGGDAGVHFFRVKESFLIYALASVELASEFACSWFSILRCTPALGGKWRLYASLELFSNFNSSGHVGSVQRLRVGLNRDTYQYGVAVNLSGLGSDYGTTDTNPGIFIRKQF